MLPERTLRMLRLGRGFVDVDFADRELFGDIWILFICLVGRVHGIMCLSY
jgi:hypothetical protein